MFTKIMHMNKKLSGIIRDYSFITLGLMIFSLGWTLFIIPAEITGGGIAGVAAVVFYSAKIPISVTYFVINIILVIIAIRVLGANFGLKTLVSMGLVTLFFALFQELNMKPIIDDLFLSAVLGGIFSGIGLGIVFTRGGSTGGTDIIAMIVNKYRNISPGRVILYCDVLIISSSYFVFQSIEKLVYGFVTMWVVSYTIDAFLSGANKSAQMFIISNKHEEIADSVLKENKRGVTVMDGTGWYTKENVKIVMTVVRKKENLNPRKVFWKCGACSHAMFHLLNHEFDNIKLIEEKASDLLAGGIAQKGHQCGMLWGGALAIGAESFRRYNERNMATAAAINASKHLIESFHRRTRTVNCRDISKVDWDNKLDFAIYMLKTIAQGFVFSPCFNLIVKWTPEAIHAANKGLSEKTIQSQPCLSCATEVVQKMGASDEEAVMVAGFAGGIGLSGNACGALGAVIWYKMLDWGKKHPGKTPAMFNNPDANKILRAFYIQTDSEMLCYKICGKQFNTIDEHSEYIKNGGCQKLIDELAKL